MFVGQHDSQASVGTSVFLHTQLACVSRCFPTAGHSCPDSGRRIDRHPSDESSLTGVTGTGYLLRLLSRRSLLMLDKDGTSYVILTVRADFTNWRPTMDGCVVLRCVCLVNFVAPCPHARARNAGDPMVFRSSFCRCLLTLDLSVTWLKHRGCGFLL